MCSADSALCIYTLTALVNFTFLHYSLYITFPTQPCLLLYSFLHYSIINYIIYRIYRLFFWVMPWDKVCFISYFADFFCLYKRLKKNSSSFQSQLVICKIKNLSRKMTLKNVFIFSKCFFFNFWRLYSAFRQRRILVSFEQDPSLKVFHTFKIVTALSPSSTVVILIYCYQSENENQSIIFLFMTLTKITKIS